MNTLSFGKLLATTIITGFFVICCRLPAFADSFIVDNAATSFTSIGSWSSSTTGPGFIGANYLRAQRGNGNQSARWTFNIPAAGMYSILASWPRLSKFVAPDAPYTIYNNGVNLGTFIIDQTTGGGKFNLLLAYTLEAGSLEVVLTNRVASNYVTADAVQVTSQLLTIVFPGHLAVETAQEVLVQASAVGFPPGWGVQFVLNSTSKTTDFTPPFERLLTGLPLAEQKLKVFMVANGVRQTAYTDYANFGVGDSYVALGDSITEGSKDNVSTDNKSVDGRIGGGGYTPILNNLLTQRRAYPHRVWNEGSSGNSSSDGVQRIAGLLTAHQAAQYWLVQYGTNDARNLRASGLGLSPGNSGYAGSFKDNMQRIITAIHQAGKEVFVAKVPFKLASCGTCTPFPDPDAAPENLRIQDYNAVIDELVAVNGISVTPPDLYNHFRSHPEQLSDNVHPNGIGYQSMAQLWANALAP